MTPSRTIALAAAALVVTGLLGACGSGTSTPEASSAALPPLSTAPAPGSAAASGGSSPSPELIAWAGDVCTATAALKTSVTGMGSAVATGGKDIGAGMSKQFETIKASADSLGTTLTAVPAEAGDGADVAALKDSAVKSKAAIDALGLSVTNLTSASGVGAVAALAGVGAAAKDAATALGASSDAIGIALKDGKGALGRAFAANPSCTALKQ
jgi:hypothetical protein